MRASLLASLALCLLTNIGLAQDQPITLWPDGPPEPHSSAEAAEELVKGTDGMTRRFNVSEPRLFVSLPNESTRTGAAMIIVPGGGFARLAEEHEGSNVAAWLVSHGITAFQLAYRTPTNKQDQPVLAPAQDVQRSVEIVRSRGAEWQLDPAKIGVIGFSAGGQAALIAAGSSRLFEGSQEVSHKPDAMLLIYPYQVMDPMTHAIRDDVNLDIGLPPVFIAQAADDRASDPAGATLLFSELLRRKVPAELHIFESGGHGFGIRPEPESVIAREWPNIAIKWLTARGFVKGAVLAPIQK